MRKLFWVGVALLAAQLIASPEAFAALKLPAMFTDGAVLQRDMPVPVWGWADPDEEVKVSFAGQSKTASVDANGKWSVTLDKLKATFPRTDLYYANGASFIDTMEFLTGQRDRTAVGAIGVANVDDEFKAELRRAQYWKRN